MHQLLISYSSATHHLFISYSSAMHQYSSVFTQPSPRITSLQVSATPFMCTVQYNGEATALAEVDNGAGDSKIGWRYSNGGIRSKRISR